MFSNYQYSIFISYRRTDRLPNWIEKVFLPPLKERLTAIFPHYDVFADMQIPIGEDWRDKLAKGIATSCVLIPIITGKYFLSKWCEAEFRLMQQRCEQTQYQRLILPILLDGYIDRQNIDERIQNIQYLTMSDKLIIGQKRALVERFIVDNLIENIITIVKEAPTYHTDWYNQAKEEFQPLLLTDLYTQNHCPRI